MRGNGTQQLWRFGVHVQVGESTPDQVASVCISSIGDFRHQGQGCMHRQMTVVRLQPCRYSAVGSDGAA